jgi:dCTP deaminase
MSFWSSEKIMQRLWVDELIDRATCDEKRVKHGAYELAMGPEAFVSGNGTKVCLGPGGQLAIPSGQFALLLTEESVSVPTDAIGFISIRAGLKFRGLVNISGFHVDPGFSGRLKFTVYNAGPREVVITRGDRLFPIWFSDLDGQTADIYHGKNQGCRDITSQDIMAIQGDIASPAQLKDEIGDLRNRVNHLLILISVLIPLVSGVLLMLLKACGEPRNGAQVPVPTPVSTHQGMPDAGKSMPVAAPPPAVPTPVTPSRMTDDQSTTKSHTNTN